MTVRSTYSSGSDLETAVTVLRAALVRPPHRSTNAAAQTFVTVSREAGAGGLSFSHRLAVRLNELPVRAPWMVWDHELAEKVSAEHGIAQTVVEMMEDRRQTWLSDLMAGLSPSSQQPDEFKVYKRVATTILAMARAGHAIIVGRGGRFITQGFPWGIHIRLVAPLETRVRYMMEHYRISRNEAANRIREIDSARAAFYRRYWPGKSLAPDCFTITLNAGEMSVEEMVDCVLPLIRSREAGLAERAAAQPN